MTKVIAITNQKGGVGKSTTTIQIGDELTNVFKFKTLLIDFDPQHTLTNHMSIQIKRGTPTIYDFIVNGIESRIKINDKLDLIPASGSLKNLMAFRDPDSPEMLRKALVDISHEYDYIIIDCPPVVTELTHNVYAAVDGLIIPANPGTYSVEGMAQLNAEVEMIKRLFNPNLKIYGILLTNVDKRTNAEKALIEMCEECCELLNTKRYKDIIYHSTVVNDAQEQRKSLRSYAKKSKASEAYHSFVTEMVGDLNE